MSRARPDFVNVRLSDAGLRMAGEAGTVGWANGRRHFFFKAGETQEVERSYEWNHLLRHERFEGDPILVEVADDAPETDATQAAEETVAPEPDEPREKVS